MNTLSFFANWKMNMDLKTSHVYIQTMLKKVPKKEQSRFVFLAPAFLLPFLKESLKNSQFKYGGQNCHFEDNGPFTGENSPLVLKQLGATYSLVGHSERRQLFFENNTLIQKKTKALLKHNIQAIICVGETSQERAKNQTFKVLEQQITPVLKTLKQSYKTSQKTLLLQNRPHTQQQSHQAQSFLPQKKPLYIAYEPVWAIGTGQSGRVKDIARVQAYIQKLFEDYGLKFYFLYGGSVNSKNIKELSKVPGINGFLVGGASLEPNTFLQVAGNS